MLGGDFALHAGYREQVSVCMCPNHFATERWPVCVYAQRQYWTRSNARNAPTIERAQSLLMTGGSTAAAHSPIVKLHVTFRCRKGSNAMNARRLNSVTALCLLALFAVPLHAGPATSFPGAGVDVLPSSFDFTLQFITNPYGIPVTAPTLISSTGTTTYTRSASYIPAAQTQHRIDTNISFSHSGTAFGGFTLTDPTVPTVPLNGGQLREVSASAAPGHFPADSLMELHFEMNIASLPGITIFSEEALFMPSAAVTELPYAVGTTHTATGWLDEDVTTFRFEDLNFLASFPMPVTVDDPNAGFVLVGYITSAAHVITPEPATAVLLLAGWLLLRRSRNRAAPDRHLRRSDYP